MQEAGGRRTLFFLPPASRFLLIEWLLRMKYTKRIPAFCVTLGGSLAPLGQGFG